MEKEAVLSIVKNNQDLLGATNVSPLNGGRASCLIFLKSNPPEGWVNPNLQ
jgi:hypothetical protein